MRTFRFLIGIALAILLGILVAWGFTFSTRQIASVIRSISFGEEIVIQETPIKEKVAERQVARVGTNSSTRKAFVKETESISLTFIGDIMVDRQVRKIAEGNSYDFLFDSVRPNLSQKDLVVGNLEGPVTDFQSWYSRGVEVPGYIFTFDPEVLTSLIRANINSVFLDNNHIYNFGREGLDQTVSYLNKAGIDYFGNPAKRNNLYKKIGGIDLTFISYNQFVSPDPEQTIENIRRFRDISDYVIVYTHWGDEYKVIPNDEQINLAHKFIDNGADIVIGTHPHVIQSKERYNGGYIYYSLGNFIFDQYFEENVRCGAVITFNLDKERIISVKEEFVYLDPEDVSSFSDCREKVDLLPVKSSLLP